MLGLVTLIVAVGALAIAVYAAFLGKAADIRISRISRGYLLLCQALDLLNSRVDKITGTSTQLVVRKEKIDTKGSN